MERKPRAGSPGRAQAFGKEAGELIYPSVSGVPAANLAPASRWKVQRKVQRGGRHGSYPREGTGLFPFGMTVCYVSTDVSQQLCKVQNPLLRCFPNGEVHSGFSEVFNGLEQS